MAVCECPGIRHFFKDFNDKVSLNVLEVVFRLARQFKKYFGFVVNKFSKLVYTIQVAILTTRIFVI